MVKLVVIRALMLIAALACGCMLHAQEKASGPWVMESSGTTAGLRGIHAVGDGSIAWASGSNGTILRTEDAGYLWQRCAVPPDAAKLDFRGIWAWDENTAIAMSSGPGNQSRIYKTTDGCAHWKLMFTNPDKQGFWDAMVFEDRKDGIILGDPTLNFVYGKPHVKTLDFTYFVSSNNGDTWSRDPFFKGNGRASEGSSAFAASNSSLTTFADNAWFGTGGNGFAYVFIGKMANGPPPNLICDCPDFYGPRFTQAALVPIANGTPSSGIFSVAFRDAEHGIAVGGDYTKPKDPTSTAAWTSDGGRHWTAATKPPHGYRSAVAWDATAKAWIAAGTNGSDVSYDDGRTWTPLGNGNWNALSLPYIVGPNGRIAKLDEAKLAKK